MHRVETNAKGRITRAKIVDPSWFNWPALTKTDDVRLHQLRVADFQKRDVAQLRRIDGRYVDRSHDVGAISERDLGAAQIAFEQVPLAQGAAAA